jgi:hypothetical protein
MSIIANKHKFSNFAWLGAALVVTALGINDCRSNFVSSSPAPGEPLPVTVQPTAIPTNTATPAPLPAPTGTTQRVNFDKGSYGATLVGSGAQRYALWAAAGQIFTVALIGDGQTSLYSTNGQPLWQAAPAGTAVTATLVGNGDQLLEIRSRGAFTVGVEIR